MIFTYEKRCSNDFHLNTICHHLNHIVWSISCTNRTIMISELQMLSAVIYQQCADRRSHSFYYCLLFDLMRSAEWCPANIFFFICFRVENRYVITMIEIKTCAMKQWINESAWHTTRTPNEKRVMKWMMKKK